MPSLNRRGDRGKTSDPLADIKPMIIRMEVAAIFVVIVSVSCHPVVVNNRSHPAPNVENIDWKVMLWAELKFPQSPYGSHFASSRKLGFSTLTKTLLAKQIERRVCVLRCARSLGVLASISEERNCGGQIYSL
jgi:hypothetical protein